MNNKLFRVIIILSGILFLILGFLLIITDSKILGSILIILSVVAFLQFKKIKPEDITPLLGDLEKPISDDFKPSVSVESLEIDNPSTYPYPNNLGLEVIFFDYIVKAVNPLSGRIKTYKLRGETELELLSGLAAQNITDIKDVTQTPLRPATEPQLNYAKDLNIILPENDMTLDEMSDIISAVVDYNAFGDNFYHDDSLIRFCYRRKIPFTKYTCFDVLISRLFDCLDDKDKYAYFIFSIYNAQHGITNFDLDSSKLKAVFYKFADTYENDPKFIKSFHENIRYFSDNYTKTTTAYTYAEAYLKSFSENKY